MLSLLTHTTHTHTHTHTYTHTHTHTHTQNLEDKFRFTASEWGRIEHKLTRERGLWGPDNPSKVDKWILDCVEGK